MSRPDLDRNRQALSQAFQEVSNPQNSTDWILFGYEGQTNVIKLVSKGDEGIEELLDDLSGGKIMYAYCRVKDPNTGLPKFVLINWQGEGVPEIKKGSCASHITDLGKFLKGAHVTINARCDEDVDEEDIMKKVAKASGANYSFHKEKPQAKIEPIGPVSSVYQKTRPHTEIKPKIRDDFWKKEKEEEAKRTEELRMKAIQEKQKIDRETKEREKNEAFTRDQRERDRMQGITQMKEAERRANLADTAGDKAAWEKQQVEAMREEQDRQKRGDHLRQQRTAEAQSLVSQRNKDPRSQFEQKPVSQFDQPAQPPPPSRKLKHDFGDQPSEPAGRKMPIQLPKAEDEPSSPPAVPPSREAASAPPVAKAPVDMPPTRNLLAQNIPKRQDSDDDEEEEQNWDVKAAPVPPKSEPSTEDFSMPESSLPPQDLYDDVREPPSQDTYDDVTVPSQDLYDDVSEAPQDVYDDVRQPQQEAPQDIYDDVSHAAEDVTEDYDKANVGGGGGAGGQEFVPELGIVARALYDYQAAEENEINFDPDDLITNIDKIDAGWWVGVAPDGSQGMFPSNYVEILND